MVLDILFISPVLFPEEVSFILYKVIFVPGDNRYLSLILAGVPEVTQGRGKGGEPRIRGIQGAGQESWAAGTNCAKEAICHILSL